MSIWGLIVGVGLISLLLRASSLVLLRGRPLPEALTRALPLVPAAVLSALILPDVVVQHGQLHLLSVRPLVALVAALVAWHTNSVLWTLITGLGLLFTAQHLGWP